MGDRRPTTTKTARWSRGRTARIPAGRSSSRYPAASSSRRIVAGRLLPGGIGVTSRPPVILLSSGRPRREPAPTGHRRGARSGPDRPARRDPVLSDGTDITRGAVRRSSPMAEAITLRVAEAFQQDIGLGNARLDVGTRQKLKVGVGDIVEIRGRKTTAAIVNRAQAEDEGRGVIRVEAVVRRNAGVSIGDRVLVQ